MQLTYITQRRAMRKVILEAGGVPRRSTSGHEILVLRGHSLPLPCHQGTKTLAPMAARRLAKSVAQILGLSLTELDARVRDAA